jgi:alanyl-tRNA synthetase
MQSKEIRTKWTQYFKDSGHLHLPSASLVPNNPTLLLTNAGMVPFVPYFLGQQKPPNSRIVTVQKCVRVGGKDSDLENIGKTPRHLTFFEMLGNFSFGDYFKEEVIPWAWTLLTEVYGFKPEQLIVSIFEGDGKVGADEEAFKIWHKKVGVPESRIMRMGRADNFWGPPGGISGPCGPCSEIYFDPGNDLSYGFSEPIEIWNLVFMQYEQFEDSSLKPLPKPNVDTGAGLERMAAILQKKPTVFETDLMRPIMEAVKRLELDTKNQKLELATKIIADHLRCSSMLIADGVRPSNLGRGYVLRMLIRRAARFGLLVGLNEPFMKDLLPTVQEVFAGAYPELDKNLRQIAEELTNEEVAFDSTLERGLKKFNDLIEKAQNKKIGGEAAFDLYATYGFPVELTIDLAEENGLMVDLEDYNKAKEKHSEVSNQGKFAVGFKTAQNSELASLAATEFVGYEQDKLENAKVLWIGEAGENRLVVLNTTPFYAESGGQLADHGIIQTADGKKIFEVSDVQKANKVFVHSGRFLGEPFTAGEAVSAQINVARRAEIKKHHTATHLLQAALRQVLGTEVGQAGSQVDANKLRFDFTAAKSLDKKQLAEVEALVNNWVKQSLPVKTASMSMAEATEQGALAFFGDKYDDVVRVLQVGNVPVSIELCGGTHITNTAEIGAAKVVLEAAISAGTRRIEMMVGESLLDHLQKKASILEGLAAELKTPEDNLLERLKALQEEFKNNQKKMAELDKELTQFKAESLLQEVKEIDGRKILIAQTNLSALKEALDFLALKIGDNYILFLANGSGLKLAYAAKVSPGLANQLAAKDLVTKFARVVGGSGGGRPDFAQGGGGQVSKMEQGFKEIKAAF